MKRPLLCLALGLAALGTVVSAHHSIAGVYDNRQQVTLDGVVTHFQFVNPHPYVMAAVPGADGTSNEWRLEMDNRNELAAVGVTAETLQAGDHIVVTGSRARDQSRGLYVRRLDRTADGFWYEQIGNSPRIFRGRARD